jgi:hypothetical protein
VQVCGKQNLAGAASALDRLDFPGVLRLLSVLICLSILSFHAGAEELRDV